MFEDYRETVLSLYEERKISGALSSNLERSTPKRLKEECLICFNHNYSKKDEKTLIAFFGRTSESGDYHKIIRNFETTKFKPLDNFLKKKTTQTDDKNIELLAWLINFEQRPYSPGNLFVVGYKTPANEIERPIDRQIGANEQDENPEISVTKKSGSVSRPKKISVVILSSASILILGALGYFFYLKGQTCMYWTGDHYETVACDRKIQNSIVLPLNWAKLNSLKKVTEPDTITDKSMGRLWYVKVNVDSIEFYTAKGEYPLDTNKILKPLTRYIIDKYVSKR